MKPFFTLIIAVCFLMACNGSRVHNAIGAEKIEKYMQPGFKPRNKKEKAEYEMVKKQVAEDAKRAKKPAKTSSTF